MTYTRENCVQKTWEPVWKMRQWIGGFLGHLLIGH